MFLGCLYEHFNIPQYIMSCIITLLCMHMYDINMTQQRKWRDIIPLIPNQQVLNKLLGSHLYKSCKNGGSISSCPPWYPTAAFPYFIILVTLYCYLLSIIDIIYPVESSSAISMGRLLPNGKIKCATTKEWFLFSSKYYLSYIV